MIEGFLRLLSSTTPVYFSRMASDPYREIIGRVKRYEGLLVRQYGASGNGLGEKVRSVEDRLSPELVRQLLQINRTRNRLAHEEGFSQFVNVREFQQQCQQIESGLKRQNPAAGAGLLKRLSRRLKWRRNIG